MNVLCISGSLRSGSYNNHLLDHLAGYLPQICRRDVLLPEDADLPLFNEDIEGDARLREKVVQLHRRFSACRAIIVATPEYNGQMTAYLKNMIDWVSRLAHIDQKFANPFLDKPLLLCSASIGSSGGMAGIAHARALFGYVGAMVLGGAICVPFAADKWSDLGFMFEDSFEGYIAASVSRLASVAAIPRT
jgi:NAD(P)H-dependent FMN reductase